MLCNFPKSVKRGCSSNGTCPTYRPLPCILKSVRGYITSGNANEMLCAHAHVDDSATISDLTKFLNGINEDTTPLGHKIEKA